MHPFMIDPSGHLYVDVATATNSCQPLNRSLESKGLKPCTELETRGGVWLYDANKTNQKFSPAERYATGIRNAEGIAQDGKGNVYVTQHGRDQLHSNWPNLYTLEQEATLPAEELMHLKKGGDYGWPECYFDPKIKKLILAPEYGGDAKKSGECAQKSGPVAAFPAHWAPDGMAYYDKTAFPESYRNGVYIAFHGSWNRAPYPQRGYLVVFQALTQNAGAGRCEIFADGFAGGRAPTDGRRGGSRRRDVRIRRCEGTHLPHSLSGRRHGRS
jgi:glucose/arabinose dehydrogenase